MSSSGVNKKNVEISLEEIERATDRFNNKRRMGGAPRVGDIFSFYKGQLSGEWQNRTAAFQRRKWHPHYKYAYLTEIEFNHEYEMISSCDHENIISIIGYHDDDLVEKIIVFEYAENGSLVKHLQDPEKRRLLTWADRLNICLGAAKGLEYLHSGRGVNMRVIHREVNSATILLDGNMVAKISNFCLSVLDKPHLQYTCEGPYTDPIYLQTGTINTELDVYSFGVVLFEMLTGMLAGNYKSMGDGQPQNLINLVRRYYDEGLSNLIDHPIRDEISTRSFKVFTDLAYRCISLNLKDRPRMGMIVKKIREALHFQNNPSSTMRIQSLDFENLEHFVIPLEEISMATGDCSSNNPYGSTDYGEFYIGQLSKQRQNHTALFKHFKKRHEFVTEVKMRSIFHHENILRFTGYCDQDDKMIIVSEFPGDTLHNRLNCIGERSSLTWAQRVKICLGAARGLEYLHSGLGQNRAVIHRNVRCTSIFLDDNMDAKLGSFALSLLVNQNQRQVNNKIADTYNHPYLDPDYKESGRVSTGTDVYSFGILLFEMLHGRSNGDCTLYNTSNNDYPQKLLNLVHPYYDDDGLGKIIDPNIRDQINITSFATFNNIAYQCISQKVNERPTMKMVIKKIEEAIKFQNNGTVFGITTRSRESYLIPLVEINLALGNLNSETVIGSGGFGKVYKGKLSENCTVAIKCLNREGHQGKKEFDKEIDLISSFHHPNIIPFVGYCNEHDQMILVYQYAANGSLDNYLEDRVKMRSLTWAQRLNICLGAAKGLEYLHSGLGKQHKVIHRDVKSGNILLDENLEAKISDFGLSTKVDQESSKIYTNVAGTNHYLDPIYYESSILRKEADVYSFGVVLFEMLSGRPAYCDITFVDGNPQFLINLVRRYYENGPKKLIDPDLKDNIDDRSFHTFKEIAYQCISFISAQRPTMETIIATIEAAIDFQESAII